VHLDLKDEDVLLDELVEDNGIELAAVGVLEDDIYQVIHFLPKELFEAEMIPAEFK